MEKIWLTIIDHKRNPLVWPALLILWIGSVLYSLGVRIRHANFKETVHVKTPVISIGNITVGGTGKTPVVIAIARHFLSQGKKVGIASSGYGRKSKSAVAGMGKELLRLTADEIGDEMLMVAEILPSVYIAVARHKREAASILDEKFKLDIILVDDGFQHRWLHRDMNILVIDPSRNLYRESLFPLGRLREPLSAIRRAEVILFTRADSEPGKLDLILKLNRQFPGMLSVQVEFDNCEINSHADRITLDNIKRRRVYFFAGIGSFTAVLNSLIKCGLTPIGYKRFSDHCRYSQNDLHLIKKDIETYHPDFVITTHKDYVKLRDFDIGSPLYYLKLRLKFDSEGDKMFAEMEKLLK